MMDGYTAGGPVKWLITIVDRGKGEKVSRIYNEHLVYFNKVVLGIGTARSEIMNYLGLDEPEKDLVLSLVRQNAIDDVIEQLNTKFQFYRPGSGIAFTIPLSGISLAASKQADERKIEIAVDKEVTDMEKKQQYDLIVSVVDRGQTDLVMDAAKAAGATGGTVVRAKGLDAKETEKFLNITIHPEKEIVMIIVAHDLKQMIMKGICSQVHASTGERAITFSIPIDDVTGINTPYKE